jgi:hypothetical protein
VRGFAVGSRRATGWQTVSDRVDGEVISLASRRRVVVGPAVRVPDPPKARRPVLALTLGAALLVAALAAGARSRTVTDIRAMSADDRARIFARALEDLKTACADPALADGTLREHCRAQAQFLTLFPECDRACQSITAGALPHARR